METFPSIGKWLSDDRHKDTRGGSPTSRSDFYAGYTQRINRFSWVPKVFHRTLANLTLANRTTLQTFEDTVKFGQDAFNWTDTISGTVYQVYFHSSTCPLEFSIFGGTYSKFKVPVSLIQASPDEIPIVADPIAEGSMQYQIEDLAVGVDITDRPIFSRAYAYEFTKASIITEGTPAGIDDSNTCVITLKNGAGTTIVTKTYNTATQPPTSDSADLGALSVTSVAAYDIVTLTVTQGATANLPPFSIVLE